jgi:hypothetical protein
MKGILCRTEEYHVSGHNANSSPQDSEKPTIKAPGSTKRLKKIAICKFSIFYSTVLMEILILAKADVHLFTSWILFNTN